ncbi:hypothetical protein [Sphingopyxis sp.]|uniref:hypothetical protein n=1 Tax=Sphingopyxis sp. TaxID=1908224 RepID=UPI002D78F6C7|nr:hypothetical protein [Sphingopyxis sp.]HET6523875.1 hypothetical protein [Sphingopyxis sp.]
METETQACAALRLLKRREIGLVTYYLVSRPVIDPMAGLSFYRPRFVTPRKGSPDERQQNQG